MKNNHLFQKQLLYTIIFFTAVILCLNCPQETHAANNLPVPDRLVATKKSETSIRLKWKACEKVDGYYVYRYNKKKGKYIKIKKIEGAKRHTWVDKNRKPNKLYRYKVASYKKKKKSKKSYEVSAMSYGRNARTVNAEDVDIGIEDQDENGNYYLEIGICDREELQMYTNIHGDNSVKYYAADAISNKLIWKSSDPSLASVDQTGAITTYEKEGKCEITARAHNGVTGRINLTVVNYARPKSFPYYDGTYPDVNRMLMEYGENLFNIATYFTIKGKEGVYGRIEMDEEENIIGYPDFDNIESIYSDMENILKNYPAVVRIDYGKGVAHFEIVYGGSGGWTRIDYLAKNDFSNYPGGRIAPHWAVTNFVPEGIQH